MMERDEHLFIAIKPDLFISKEEFENRMDTFVSRVKSLPRAQGFEEILIPGEPEERKAIERLESGIPLTIEVRDSLHNEAKHLGINLSDIL
ncbi:Ldh family oxidoreductase [Peribacillus sp. SCS-155]|uniref:Ldh family oxidoreductase n=1 Tax=Peribacillus sedimenti TaxID=3115297 RepID=UPI003906AF7F